MSKTWLITGASSGFGRELTAQLLARGDSVAATARRPETLDDLTAAYGNKLWVAKLDVTDFNNIQQVVDKAFHELGRIDVIVSNAGFGMLGAAEEASEEHIRTIIDTNLLGSIMLIRAVLPHLRAQGGGRIQQVSSEGGQIAYPGFSLYHATKWGIEGFVESVAQEVAPFGIDFTIIEPGPTRTNFGAGLVLSPQLNEYAGSPAHAIRAALYSGEWVITGDPEKMVKHMINAADAESAPLRVLLGKDAYMHVHTALNQRLKALESQKAIAESSDS